VKALGLPSFNYLHTGTEVEKSKERRRENGPVWSSVALYNGDPLHFVNAHSSTMNTWSIFSQGHSSIHSLSEDLYDVPSRVLLGSADYHSTAERTIFMSIEKVRVDHGDKRGAKGSPFHSEGPTTEKA